MKTKKYLLIGLSISLVLHIILFFSLSLLTKKEEKRKPEKKIYIKLIPYEKHKNLAKHKKAKKEKKKGLPIKQKNQIEKKNNKTKSKKKPKPIKKKIKKEKKQTKPPDIKKQKKPKETIKKQLQKPITKQEDKQQKQNKDIKRKEKKPEKTIKPPEIEISKDIEQKLNKEISIPQDIFGLKGSSKKTKISKNEEDKPKKTDKKIQDYLKYIKEEFEKNKFYPLKAKKLGIEGTVIIKFTILPDGTIDTNSIKIIYSDSPILSYGAKRIFEKIKKIPKPPPDNKEITVEIPIEYILIEL